MTRQRSAESWQAIWLERKNVSILVEGIKESKHDCDKAQCLEPGREFFIVVDKFKKRHLEPLFFVINYGFML